MTTHAVGRTGGDVRVHHALSVHWAWLAGGLVVAFAVPYLLADVLEINRDLFYGLYAAAVIALFALWSRSTGYDLVAAARRRWLAALLLGIAVAAVLAAMVVRTEDATSRPDGLELAAAVAWRGIVYGVTDGLLLSVFPILVVFAAFAGTRLDRRLSGKVVIGIVALAASLTMTAVYHAGYGAYRFLVDRLRPPLWLHGHTTIATVTDWRDACGPTTVANVTGSVVVELVPPA